jgi:ABC-type thiamine transport system substrate-binding protein
LIYDLRERIIEGWSTPVTETIKLPRKLSEERKPPPPQRPSHANVIENLDRWANSPGLQPPKLPDEKTA